MAFVAGKSCIPEYVTVAPRCIASYE